MKYILITGVCGFIGSNLLKRLLQTNNNFNLEKFILSTPNNFIAVCERYGMRPCTDGKHQVAI